MTSFAAAVKRRAAFSTEIGDLKNRKVELKNLIRDKEDALALIDLNMERSKVVLVDTLSEDVARAVPERVDGCYKMLRVRIQKHVIAAPWGHMLLPFDDSDGEYYLFMNGVDYFCYRAFLAGGNPEEHVDVMWKKDYGKRNCMADECWYSYNLDRRKEFKCNYFIPESDHSDRISLCNVDYENNGCRESDEYFSHLVKQYKKRADPDRRHACEVCNQTFLDKYMFECKKCAIPNICDYCWDDKMHECYICGEAGCSRCTLKRRDADFVVHAACIMPEERGDYE